MNPQVEMAEMTVFEQARQAGEVAQQLFYLFIEQTWTYDMSTVVVKRDSSGQLTGVEVMAGMGVEASHGGESYLAQAGGNWLFRFSPHAFPPQESDAKAAILADGNSVWAFVFMYDVIRNVFRYLVNDIDNDIHEVTHYLPQGASHIVTHKGASGVPNIGRTDQIYNDDDGRGVYEITLKTGEKIALDLSGQQYSLPHTTVMPWSDYWTCQGHMRSRSPFRSTYENHVRLLRDFEKTSSQTIIMAFLVQFNLLIDNVDLGIGVGKFMDLPLLDPQKFWNRLVPLVSELRFIFQHQVGQYNLTSQQYDCISGPPKGFPAGLRHPSLIAQNAHLNHHREMVGPNIGHIQDFSWQTVKSVIQSKETSYQDKKLAKEILAFRCVYKPHGIYDWRIVFVVDSLPPMYIPRAWTSENPFWRTK
ncbi:hypothetical protein K505DRAFT_374641 [Melanomma pulvis-pyrius CBS 109.77]|uniref:Uncharacterized protein n=1 Tax=Melanomma pulvis-pyrius CBS 109.77 TaxID=1314802 RepID=A0A6A6XDQ4_9PLEO|nr:hypothetical protein K505DRAFT_374641 [Melanomma pulvis-pyrius CBS 109.77]